MILLSLNPILLQFRFTYTTLVDFGAVLKISRVYSPVLLLFKEDPDIVVPLVHQAATKKHVSIM